LPFQSFREGQKELIARLATSESRYILLEAPTGSGKSAIALALVRLLGQQCIILTGTKNLQSQYTQSFGPSGLVQAQGRANFRCNLHPSVTAAQAPCTRQQKCTLKNTPECDYYSQKIVASNANEAVLNYAYWLHQANYGKAFRHPELLIADEAHTIEDQVKNFVSIEITRSQLEAAGMWFPKGFVEVLPWHEWAGDVFDLVSGKCRSLNPESIAAQRMFALLEAVSRLKNLDPEGWCCVQTRFGVEFRPVWVADTAQTVFFQHTRRVLFMSGTILDPGIFCRNLGIDPEDVEFIRAGSTFPKERRPLIYDPIGRVKPQDEMVMRRLVARVDAILDEEPGRGLVHSVNYKVAGYLMDHSRHRRRLLTHTTADRAAAVQRLRDTNGAVLISPSMGTGLDLPYELCTFQVIAKLPFPDLGDPQTKKRMKIGPDGKPVKAAQSWYNYQTACSLVQMYGRGMRAEDDECTTYLLDSNFQWFLARNRELLPGWFTEAVQYARRGERPPEISILDQIQGKRA
jgi:Rad3-related DNA helicase